MSNSETPGSGREGGSMPQERVIRAILVPDSSEEPAMFDLAAILAFVRKHWFTIAVSAMVGAVVAFGSSYAFPKTYRAEVLLAASESTEEGSGLEGLISKYGALASAVGIGLPQMRGGSTAAALARLQSRTFIEDFIADQNLLAVLYPDEPFYTLKSSPHPQADPKRTLQDGYRKFTKRIMLVKHDKVTNLVTIRIDWKDRQLAADWANELASRLNAVMRATAIQETERSLEYLRAELAKADYVKLKDSISSLMETQVNKRMLALTQPDYAFRVIDPAKPSDANKKISPQRVIFAVVGFTLGALIGVLLALRRQRGEQGDALAGVGRDPS